jgi:hypothetical protein
LGSSDIFFEIHWSWSQRELGVLAGKPLEPINREEFIAVLRRLRDSCNGSVTADKKDGGK